MFRSKLLLNFEMISYVWDHPQGEVAVLRSLVEVIERS